LTACSSSESRPFSQGVAAHPHAHVDVELVVRVEIDAAEHTALVGRDDGIGERAPRLELLLMPAEDDEVLVARRLEPRIWNPVLQHPLVDRLEVLVDVVDRQHAQPEAGMLERLGHVEVLGHELVVPAHCSHRQSTCGESRSAPAAA
jgi:hypothetical protein